MGAQALATSNSVILHLLGIFYLSESPPYNGNPHQRPAPLQPNVNEVCLKVYDTTECFSLTPPWVGPKRPIIVSPMQPVDIATTFKLYTRANVTHPQILHPGNLGRLLSVILKPSLPFKILIHGYLSSSNSWWMKMTAHELLRAGDYNVVIVDWSRGAAMPYSQAVANIRMVSRQLSYLIYSLHRFADVDMGLFHVIGHSLGAHLGGSTGSHLKEGYGVTLGRITALDPAFPFFNGTDPMTRLDPSDATFVDVVHTDNEPILGFPLSLGMMEPIGHVDFYPNGGGQQPGCGGASTCQHRRAITLFLESIRQTCPFIGVTCDSYSEFVNGSCWGCDEGTCNTMGYHVHRPTTSSINKVYLMTRDRSPFCGYHYRITVEVSNSSEAQEHSWEYGKIYVALEGTMEVTQPILFSERNDYYEAGNVKRRVILAQDLGVITRLKVEFIYPSSVLNPASWRLGTPVIHLKSIAVERLDKPYLWRYCFDYPTQQSGTKYVLTTKNLC